MHGRFSIIGGHVPWLPPQSLHLCVRPLPVYSNSSSHTQLGYLGMYCICKFI